MTRNSGVMGWCVCVYSAVAPLLNTHVKGGGFVQANPLKGVNSSAITPGLLLLSVIAICRPRSVPGSLCSGGCVCVRCLLRFHVFMEREISVAHPHISRVGAHVALHVIPGGAL